MIADAWGLRASKQGRIGLRGLLGLMPILDGCHWAQDGNASTFAWPREPMAERVCLLVHHEHGSTATQTSVRHLKCGWRPPYLPIGKMRADRRHLPANTAGRSMTDLAPHRIGKFPPSASRELRAGRFDAHTAAPRYM